MEDGFREYEVHATPADRRPGALHGHGCRGRGDDERLLSGSTQPAATADADKKIKVGMVTDIGGLDDRSFNQSAYNGLKRAQSELGVDIRALNSKSNADYVPNLTTLARQKYDLVIGVGFLMAEAVEKVANAFPTRTSRSSTPAGGDEVEAEERRGPPVQGERGRLPRRLHGRPVRQGPGRRPGDLGGRRPEDPAGRRATSPATRRAPRRPNPDIKTLNAYSQDFVDQAKCKELALNQIARGLAGRLPGRRRLRPRRARRGEGEGQAGHRRRRRPGLSRRPHHDVGAQEGRRGRRSRPSSRSRTARSRPAPTRSSTPSRAASATARRTPRARSTRTRSTQQLEKIKPGEITDIPTKLQEAALTEASPPARPRAEGRHQALRRARRERQRRPRPASRRGARPARGERRREVHAHERPLRAATSPTRARSVSAASRCTSARRARRSACGSAWCTSTSC